MLGTSNMKPKLSVKIPQKWTNIIELQVIILLWGTEHIRGALKTKQKRSETALSVRFWELTEKG